MSEVAVLMNNVLFLCTGNYYRSRFCEAYFNHLAGQRARAWRAESRGLAPDITVFRNPGPLSLHTRQALTALGVSLDSALRYPLSAQPEDLARAQSIIALSRIEHEPMVKQRFPVDAHRIEYWEIGDLPLASPVEAVAGMTEAVQRLVAALSVSHAVLGPHPSSGVMRQLEANDSGDDQAH
ncbi:MAG: low molecular weight phosphatase family protein [Candidatus Competibacteraceae bacterium]|nr:low molecular weight phosphatase family protein [Candidatus Competibacteraceae bacterium]MCB1819988.1 low molecular weight phosphatase family protein [Candidatus Competibacteraceae bacterium]